MDLGVDLRFLCTGMGFEEPRLRFYAQAWGLRSLGGVSGVDLDLGWIWGGSGADLGWSLIFCAQAWGLRNRGFDLMHRHGV